MLTGLVKKLAWKIGIGRVTKMFRDAAEGRLGPEWKRRYEWTIGKKAVWGFFLASVGAVLLALDIDKTGATITAIGGVLLQWGFVDKAWRNDIPAFLRDSTLYRVLVSLSADITAAMVTLWAAMQTQDCAGFDPETCGRAKVVVLVIGTVLAQMGILDSAWKSRKPRTPLPDARGLTLLDLDEGRDGRRR